MLRFSAQCALLFLATAGCYFAECDADSKKCRLDGMSKMMGGSPDLTCCKPKPYCCRHDGDRPPAVFCCDDCQLSMDSDDCDYSSHWKYIGYGIGCIALLCLLVGLGFGLVKLVKFVCCKHRSPVVSSATAGPQTRSPDYPRNIDSVPEWQQPPKKPPEYYDIFTVTPPPVYKERPESA